MERHTQTVLVMVLVALLLWVGVTVQRTSVTVAELKVEVGHLHDTSDGDEIKFQRIERRLDAIESQLGNLRKEQ